MKPPPAPAERDTPRERRLRALIGRRGCREAETIAERLGILAYVIWHQDASLIASQIEDLAHDHPGIIASYMHQAFKREFKKQTETTYPGYCKHYPDKTRLYVKYKNTYQCATCITTDKMQTRLYSPQTTLKFSCQLTKRSLG